MADSPRADIEQRLVLRQLDAASALNEVISMIRDLSAEDSIELRDIAVRALAPVLSRAQASEWFRIEKEARSDSRFLRALAFAHEHAFSARERAAALLNELGERRPVQINFFVYPSGFGVEGQYDWSGLDIETQVNRFDLAALLRSIAHYLDYGQHSEHLPSSIKHIDPETVIRLDDDSIEPFAAHIPETVRRSLAPGYQHFVRAMASKDPGEEAELLCRVDITLDDGERIFTQLIVQRDTFNALPIDLTEEQRRVELLNEELSRPMHSWLGSKRSQPPR